MVNGFRVYLKLQFVFETFFELTLFLEHFSVVSDLSTKHFSVESDLYTKQLIKLET